jgi:hypothetical protein
VKKAARADLNRARKLEGLKAEVVGHFGALLVNVCFVLTIQVKHKTQKNVKQQNTKSMTPVLPVK